MLTLSAHPLSSTYFTLSFYIILNLDLIPQWNTAGSAQTCVGETHRRFAGSAAGWAAPGPRCTGGSWGPRSPAGSTPGPWCWSPRWRRKSCDRDTMALRKNKAFSSRWQKTHGDPPTSSSPPGVYHKPCLRKAQKITKADCSYPRDGVLPVAADW